MKNIDKNSRKVDLRFARPASTGVTVCAQPEFAAPIKTALSRLGVACRVVSERAGVTEEAAVVVVDVDSTLDIEAVARGARARNAHTLVVAVGSNPTKELFIEMIRAGVYDFHEKPVNAAVFAARLRALSERAYMGRFNAEVNNRLRGTQPPPDRSEYELHREIVRSNEDLQSLNERLHRVVSQIKTLYHMGHDLASNENWSDALDRFLMALVNFMDADGAALMLFSNYESVLAPRAHFQMDDATVEDACRRLLTGWHAHPRGSEIHCLESYSDGNHAACLERLEPWGMTVIPLRHRNRALGFLIMEKAYEDRHAFKWDYDFLNTLQTIFVEEIANANYISELRRLGRFNNKVLDNIGSGVVTTDLEGTIRYHNASAAQLCPRLEVSSSGLHFDELFASTEFGADFFRQLLRSAADSHVLEVECHASVNVPFPARLRAARMYDDNLGGTVIVAIFEDLTDQKRMESEIRRNDRLRALGQLSAGVAHEIRNPLTGIANCAEVLAGKLGDDPAKTKYTRAMLDEIRRLDGIIRNLLDFARPARPQLGACHLVGVAEKVQTLLSEDAASRGVSLSMDTPSDELYCRADSGQLTQVLLNVVSNAIQACDGGGTVRVELSADPQPGGVARIEVIDDGPGIPQEIRESLFEPFVTTKTRGTGLGLAISHQIMEDHQGRIECKFLERGTRFSIELPQVAPTEPRNQPSG